MDFHITDKVLHFKQPAGTSRGVYTTHHSYYVTLEEDGISGTGECSTLPDLSCDAMSDASIYRITPHQIIQSGDEVYEISH